MSALPSEVSLEVVVSCFHESDDKAPIPQEAMGVRTLLVRTLGESERPDIIKGGFSFWQWDKWVFCAAYQGAFSGPKEGLHTRAKDLDSQAVPANYVGPYVPTNMSQVAGHEALRYLIKRGGLLENPTTARYLSLRLLN